MNEGPTPRDIEEALRARVDTLVPELIKGATRDGQFWSCSSVDGGPGTQMKINRTGPRRGLWTDFSEAEGTDRYSGDMLQLVAIVHFGGWSNDDAKSKSIAWAKSWLGWDDLDKDRLAKVRRQAAARDEAAAAVAAKEIADKRRSAFAMWCGAVKIEGTPAEIYLRGRGIDFDRLGRIPGSLRYLPDCWCGIRSPVTRRKYPAMVASIYCGSEFQATHRTFLDVSEGKGGRVSVVKVFSDPQTRKVRVATLDERKSGAKLKSHKLTLGQYSGGCIVLWKGGRSGPFGDIPKGTRIYASEGIEDGLSVAIADPSLTVVAGVSLSNLGNLIVPPQAGPLVFIGQNDAIDGKAIEAFERAIAKQQRAAREAGRALPELFFPPRQFKDFNDQLLGKVMA
jgi:hypothetical protein